MSSPGRFGFLSRGVTWQRLSHGVAVVLAVCVLRSLVAAQDFSGAAIVSSEDAARGRANQSPTVATDGTNWIATWWSEQIAGWSLQVARSTDHGATWALVTNQNDSEHPLFTGGVSPGTLACGDWQPGLAAGTAGQFVVAWSRQDASGSSQLYASKSTDGGQTWGPERQLTNNVRNECPRIAYGLDQESGGNGRWTVVWSSHTSFVPGQPGNPGDRNWDIKVARLTDEPSSLSLTDQVALSSGAGKMNMHPDVATDGQGRWLVAWSQYDLGMEKDRVSYAYSSDLSAPWSITDVSGYFSSCSGTYPGGIRPVQVATDGAVWEIMWGGGYEASSLWPPTGLALATCSPTFDLGVADLVADPSSGKWVLVGSAADTVPIFGSIQRLKFTRGEANGTTGSVDWDTQSDFVYTPINPGTSSETGQARSDAYGSSAATNGTHWVLTWSSTESLDPFSGASTHNGNILVTSSPRCGDGGVDPDETCDDGNRTNGDGCDNNCTPTVCGNGAVSAPETCDDGNAVDGDGCDSNCQTTGCGNGVLTAGEVCDDGDLTNGDGCDANCTPTGCGNGIPTAPEACDDGNAVDGDGCDSNCTTGCGNGIATGSEICDDGNVDDGDGCDSNCKPTGCGNGIATGSETCDDGNAVNGDGCDNNCKPTGCGNGIVTGPEICDDGNVVDGDGCDSNCTPTGCGNGLVTAGEWCDDGNAVNGDGCDSVCLPTECGNGVVTAGEICDDFNEVSGDGCDANCTPTGCGNGIATGVETCDDGNAVSGDGCDVNCTPTGCNNGIQTAGEACDDGNAVDTDGCDTTCNVVGCGNGSVEGSEQCDDGNPVDGDGCDGNCTASGCGNGVRALAEQCDDGNAVDGDGCQSDCTFTPGVFAGTAAAEGTFSTDSGSGATPASPVQVGITTPTGGDISIALGASTQPPPQGYGLLGQQIVITAPVESQSAPLRIVFVLDATVMPLGLPAGSVNVTRNGALVADCSGPAGQAVPNPCIESRASLPGGDVEIAVLTSAASTWALLGPAHDAVVGAIKPVKFVIARNKPEAVKKISVVVGNADAGGASTFRLSASTTCPGATVSTPDFDTKTALDDTVSLAAGKTKKATVLLTISQAGIASITTLNKTAPFRCAVTFVATTVAPAGSVDPNPGNSSVTVRDVNIVDKNDAPQATTNETTILSLKPVKVVIPKGTASVVENVKVQVVNADIFPAPATPGHTMTVTAADGTCPAGTMGSVDFAPAPGEQNTVVGAGGQKKTGQVRLTINAASFTTPGAASPSRCLATVTASGPAADGDVSSNTTQLVIDVIDKNDF